MLKVHVYSCTYVVFWLYVFIINNFNLKSLLHPEKQVCIWGIIFSVHPHSWVYWTSDTGRSLDTYDPFFADKKIWNNFISLCSLFFIHLFPMHIFSHSFSYIMSSITFVALFAHLFPLVFFLPKMDIAKINFIVWQQHVCLTRKTQFKI